MSRFSAHNIPVTTRCAITMTTGTTSGGITIGGNCILIYTARGKVFTTVTGVEIESYNRLGLPGNPLLPFASSVQAGRGTLGQWERPRALLLDQFDC